MVGGEQGGGGWGWEETKFMAQNVTLTRNVTTSKAICKIKSLCNNFNLKCNNFLTRTVTSFELKL